MKVLQVFKEIFLMVVSALEKLIYTFKYNLIDYVICMSHAKGNS